MSLKLSSQLDADADVAFALYKKYFDKNRWLFPESVIEVMENSDWIGGVDSKSPHDGELKNISITGIGTNKSIIELLLFKSWRDLNIKVTYMEVLDFNLPSLGNLHESHEWRYEQFLYFDPYHSHGIKNKKMFTHDIEWQNGVIWSITASDIEVIWSFE